MAVQGTLESLSQQHSSEASVPQHSAFFTGKVLSAPQNLFVGSSCFPRRTRWCQQLWAKQLSCKRGFHPKPADHALENLSARCFRPSICSCGQKPALLGRERDRRCGPGRGGQEVSIRPLPPLQPHPSPGKSQEGGGERDSSFS